MTHTLTVEFDCDENRVYAYVQSSDGEFIRDFAGNNDLDALLAQSNLIANGRWDGQTSTKLCPDYEGRSCTTGGRQEIYALNYFDAASISYD